jgi:hypothetical protein
LEFNNFYASNFIYSEQLHFLNTWACVVDNALGNPQTANEESQK